MGLFHRVEMELFDIIWPYKTRFTELTERLLGCCVEQIVPPAMLQNMFLLLSKGTMCHLLKRHRAFERNVSNKIMELESDALMSYKGRSQVTYLRCFYQRPVCDRITESLTLFIMAVSLNVLQWGSNRDRRHPKKNETNIKVCPNTIKITFYLLSPASTMQYRRATKEGQNTCIYIYIYINNKIQYVFHLKK